MAPKTPIGANNKVQWISAQQLADEAPKSPIGANNKVKWISTQQSAQQFADRQRSRSRKGHRCVRIRVQAGDLPPTIQFVVPQRDIIGQVKEKAAFDNNIDKDLLGVVMFKGKALKDESTLSDCQIQACDLLKIQMTKAV